jgi:hypothetical protein
MAGQACQIDAGNGPLRAPHLEGYSRSHHEGARCCHNNAASCFKTARKVRNGGCGPVWPCAGGLMSRSRFEFCGINRMRSSVQPVGVEDALWARSINPDPSPSTAPAAGDVSGEQARQTRSAPSRRQYRSAPRLSRQGRRSGTHRRSHRRPRRPSPIPPGG